MATLPLKLLRALAGGLILLALGSLLAFSATVGRTSRSATTGAVASVPDALLLVRSPTPTGALSYLSYLAGSEVALLDLTSNAVQPILAGAREPVVAPDGRQLFFVQHRQRDDRVAAAIVALAADSFAHEWTTEVASARNAEPYSLALDLAVAGDRVYVASHETGTASPLQIVALDRATGRAVERQALDLEGNHAPTVRLVVAPDGTGLYLLAGLTSAGGESAQTGYFRFSLPDLRLERRDRAVGSSGQPGFSWWGRVTADGAAIYNVQEGGTSGVAVSFSSLAAPSVEQVALTFERRASDYVPIEQALSHDGRRLYLLAPTIGELAIVDLERRGVEQIVALDTSTVQSAAAPTLLGRVGDVLRGLFVREAVAKIGFPETLPLSPDGRRLYAVGIRGEGHLEMPDGIWVIDTTSWRVVEHWLPGLYPAAVILSGDGRHLWVQESPWSSDTSADAGVLHALDASTGAEVFRSDALPGAQVFSLADLYRRAYGRSATVAGVRPSDNPELRPIAALAVSASPRTIVADDDVTIEARFVDPSSGESVQPGRPEVRYDPPADVTAVFCRGNDRCDGPSVALDAVDFGVYRGSARLEQAASWTVRVTAEWPDGLRRRAVRGDAVVVQAAFSATDGRRYVLRLTTEPDPVVVGEEATLRAALVDARTGAPLPEGAELAGGQPARLEAALYSTNGAGVRVGRLEPVGHGAYAGPVRLWAPGTWRTQVKLLPVGERAVDFAAGSVEVAPR